jgi:hypothetical protein
LAQILLKKIDGRMLPKFGNSRNTTKPIDYKRFDGHFFLMKTTRGYIRGQKPAYEKLNSN